MEERIIQHTLKLFRMCEYRTVTMDDVAKKLGISKRTLYQLFKNKESFFRQCVDYRIRQLGLQEQDDNNETALDLLASYADCFDNQSAPINYQCCKYIWAHHRDVYQYILEHIERFARACGNKVDDGIRRGYIRSDVTPDLVYIFLLSHFINLFVYNGLSVESIDKKLAGNLIRVFIRGMLTFEGEVYSNNKLK